MLLTEVISAIIKSLGICLIIVEAVQTHTRSFLSPLLHWIFTLSLYTACNFPPCAIQKIRHGYVVIIKKQKALTVR